MGTGGCVVYKRGGLRLERFVSFDGYPSGLGVRLATLLVSGNLVNLLEFLLETTGDHDYKGTGCDCTYEVDMDASTVTVYENGVARTLSHQEFLTWCTP